MLPRYFSMHWSSCCSIKKSTYCVSVYGCVAVFFHALEFMLLHHRIHIIIKGKIRFVPPQLREIGCHVQNHATQWHGFQHEIQLQEIVVAWIKMTLKINAWTLSFFLISPANSSLSDMCVCDRCGQRSHPHPHLGACSLCISLSFFGS